MAGYGPGHRLSIVNLPAEVLRKILDTWDADKDSIWERPQQRGKLRLVCKRFHRVMREDDDTFAVMRDVRQLDRLLDRFRAKPERASRLTHLCARFPNGNRQICVRFCLGLAEVLEQAFQIKYLAVMLFNDTVNVEDLAFARLLGGMEGLRSMRCLAIMPNEYRSYKPAKRIPLRHFVTLLALPELERLDVAYLPSGGLPPGIDQPSSQLREIHTAASSLSVQYDSIIGLSHDAAERNLERWLWTPDQLKRLVSLGIVDVDSFLHLNNLMPGLFDNLRALRLDFADLPRLSPKKTSLPNLKAVQLDGMSADDNFDPLLQFDLDVVEFVHECDPDTGKIQGERNASLQTQFEIDVLDSLRGLPDGPYPFRRFVLRCHFSCGPLERLDEAEAECARHDSVFERCRGIDLGWAYT